MSEGTAGAVSPPMNEASLDTARASADDDGSSRPSSSAVCPCETTFRSSKQVLGAIHSDEATSSLITWLSDQNVREEGGDFVLIRGGGAAAAASDDNPAQPLPHADTYGRCRARVGAAFAILNAIRDGCRSHLDRQQAVGAGSAAAAQSVSSGFGSGAVTQQGFSGSAASTIARSPPSKPKYEDDFPSLGSASISSSSATISTKTPSGPANVLVPRKKKKKQPLPQQAGGATSAPNAVMKVVPAKQQKRRIRPVALSTSTAASTTSSSPWPGAISSGSSSSFAAHAVKRGNIASLPSEDPINITKSPSRDRIAKAGEQKTPTPVGRTNPPDATTTVGFGTNMEVVSTPVLKPKVKKSALAPPGFGTVDNDSSSGAQISAMPHPSKGPSIIGLPGQVTPTPNSSKVDANMKRIETDAAGKDAVPIREANEATLGRLVDIYTTLILNQLVPSVPLELHLLVRLLSLNVKANGHLSPEDSLDDKGDGGAGFRDVFCSAKSCRDFATKVLTKIEEPILSSLGEVILRKLIALPSLKRNLPEVVGNLKRITDDRGGILDKADPLEGAVAAMNIAGASNTPFLTVPFDEDRDSRHNYRSRDRTMLFNNREESRDKFMFQLRAFQEIRGTVLDPTQANVYISDIEIACREMIQGLLPGNFDWFSGLFTDLLLQIGLVAVEETDKDVLKQVADKDRLKKLHRRFTAKGGQKNRSIKKLEDKNASTTSSSFGPEHYFSGHQEFFFIFLRAVDSHQFGVHLSRRLVGLIDGMDASADARGFEDRVLKLQMLSKFLGVLVFSPGWDLSTNANAGVASSAKGSNAIDSDAKESLAYLNCTNAIMDVRKYVEEGWRNCRLIVTIPWVVEYLRMATWDSVSLQASYYQKLFALLRSVHRMLGQIIIAEGLALNCQLVMIQLEDLFSDVVGLMKAEGLPLMVLPERNLVVSGDDSKVLRLDVLPLRFTKLYIFASSSHLEELFKLVTEMVERKGRGAGRVGGASKKLRPYAITSQIGGADLSSSPSSTSPYTRQMSSGSILASPMMSPLNLISPQRGINSRRNNTIQDKLVDAFFHQHTDLRQICEFVVEKTAKNTLAIVVKEHIAPHFKFPTSAYNESFDAFVRQIRQKEQDALTASNKEMKARTVQLVTESVKLLSPRDAKPAVVDIAIKLATMHVHQKCIEHVQSVVRLEAQAEIDKYIKAEATRKRALAKSQEPSSSTQTSPEEGGADSSIAANLAESLRLATKVLLESIQSESILHATEADRKLFEQLSGSLSASLQSDNRSWKEYCQIEEEGRKFIRSLLPVIKLWFSLPLEDRREYPPFFLDSTLSAIALAKAGVPFFGLKKIGQSICDNAHQIVSWDDVLAHKDDNNEKDPAHRGRASSILLEMVGVQMITPHMLRQALDSISEGGDWGAEVASICRENMKSLYYHGST